MKKNKIYSVAIVLAVCVGMFFAGCGEKKETIKIGVMIPLTGKGSDAGVNAQQAINLCIEGWNEKGGILGKKIVANYYDAKNSESKEGAIIAKKIVSEPQKTNFVLNVISGVVMTAQPILDANKIIQLSLSGSDNLFETSPKYTIRNYPSATQVSRKIIKELDSLFHSNKIKVIYPANEWGLSSMKSIKIQANKYNVEITREVQYNEDEISFRNNIMKCDLNENDILYVIGSQERIGRLIKQIRESNFTGIIIGGSDIKTTSALNVIGNNKSNIYYTETYKSPKIKELNDKFHTKYNSDIDEISMFFYNALDLFLNYVTDCKNIDNEFIISTINGYTYNGYMGIIEVENNEIIYPFEIKKLE
jgi:branched-chain amino acid transport system substrate-binding protein